jgi:uncharacterized membrane protein YphA (DoxX/SURF4 family)
MNILLWVLQILVALLFLFAGVTKFLITDDMMKQMQALPGPHLSLSFLHFIGVLEIVGALGIILPSLLKIRPSLTVLAAIGLLIIMIGAVVITVMGQGVKAAIIPFCAGILCAFVAYGRSKVAPVQAR